MATTHTMTRDEAVTFERHSMTNALLLADAAQARGCDCKPYRDWFTYRRWLAQGYQVRKGEHGVRLGVIIATEREDEDGNKVTRTRPWGTTVFCRCQVDEVRGRDG